MNTSEERHLYVAFWAHSYGIVFSSPQSVWHYAKSKFQWLEAYYQSLQHHQLRCLRVAHHALELSRGVHPLGDCMGLHQAHDDQFPYQGNTSLVSDDTGPLLLLPHIESGTA